MLPAPVVAPIAPAAWHALVAVGAAADATLAVPRADLVAALAAALDDDDARAAQRAFDAFDDAARGARMASHTTLALLPRPPGAAAVAPLSLAAALLRRGALAGADVTDVHTCAEARALVRAARGACDVVVEERRRRAVVFFYGGDGILRGNRGVWYGGNKWRHTSHFIDFLRSLYDDDLAEQRDGIEQLARDLFARQMSAVVDFVDGLAVGQRGQIVWRLVPNIVGGRVEIKFYFRRPRHRRGLHAGRGRARGRGDACPVRRAKGRLGLGR